MESKPLHEERYIATLAERCWHTVRTMVTPPTGSEVKAGANWNHVVWNLQQTGMPRKQANAVVRRLLADRKLTARKYGASWWLYEDKQPIVVSQPIVSQPLGKKRLRARYLGI